jgi:hypothetical protein
MGELQSLLGGLFSMHDFCVAYRSVRSANLRLMQSVGSTGQCFPSGNPAIHLRGPVRLSVIRLPGFWLYTEGRMRAGAGILPVFLMNIGNPFVPPFVLDV